MGCWGTGLYSSDSTCDIRGDYVDGLKRGKTNEEITEEMIHRFKAEEDDPQEEALFWFALADTQWNYGRLLPEIKEKALGFLEQKADIEIWEDDIKQRNAWIKTRERLRQKLETEMPDPKKVYKYRFYRCPWKLGDVFAYRLTGEYSKEMGFYGKYVYFRKIGEYKDWPGNIVPVTQIYSVISDEIINLEEIVKYHLLNVFCPQKTKEGKWIDLSNYSYKEGHYMVLLCTSGKRRIPKNNLIFLGNYCDKDIMQEEYGFFLKDLIWTEKGFRSFEQTVIDQYRDWNDDPS